MGWFGAVLPSRSSIRAASVGRRTTLTVPGHDDADPLVGVEENIAYNAFLVGKSLLGMRVTDVLVAVRKIVDQGKGRRVVLCGRRDAALVALFATCRGTDHRYGRDSKR